MPSEYSTTTVTADANNANTDLVVDGDVLEGTATTRCGTSSHFRYRGRFQMSDFRNY
jgi:hypothetical protein